jgi:AcrR family transcriptional regulator
MADGAVKRYHHGDLRAAILDTAEAILEQQGAAALTLRAAARAAGVSHAAPAHHFGDLRGLLSELAALGFERFVAHLSAAMAAAPEDRRFLALGLAYIDFARRWPGMFTLMFRSESLDEARPALVAAQQRASDLLAGGVSATRSGSGAEADDAADAIAAWSMVHGLAVLLLDRRLPPEAAAGPMIEAVLSRLAIG